MNALNRDAILGASDLPVEEVEVPEWGGSVFLRSMTGSERDQWEMRIHNNGPENISNIRASLLVLTLVDKDGNRLFKDKDIEALGAKSSSVLSRLFDVARKLNALSSDDVEELAGN